MNTINLPPDLGPSFELGAGERRSPTWIALEEHYTKRLADLRAQNDTPKDELATAMLRGKIAEVKELLKLGKDKPPTS